ncbi:HipA family kinase [Bacillus sp. Marseille-P3661]|uniref:HipA family kinase n=1 Tax=Bacillus sp. Marseille-P3661 TaxID=1936234 RepID=UPI000C828F84|nr:HipA family kinase [Bacillus sp. Marseille-P3661]
MDQNQNIRRPLYPVKYVQAIKERGPHVFLFNDGKKYVVKWKSDSSRKKEVVNEYVVSKLASLLSLPVIPYELVYIPKDFIEKTSQLNSSTVEYRPGYHFGCLFIENSSVFADIANAPPSKLKIKNREELTGMILFDQWVYNSDRNINNLLLEHLGDGGYVAYMIDHGRCFPGRYKWSTQTLCQKPEYRVFNYVYQWCFSLLDNPDSFISFAQKIQSLPDELIRQVIQSIPDDWEVSDEEKEALFQYLIRQKHHLPNVATFFRKVIPMMDDITM